MTTNLTNLGSQNPAEPVSASQAWRAGRSIENLPDRGFGIEMELSPVISREAIAALLRNALQASGRTREVRIEGYGHAGASNHAWIVKTDASAGRTPSELGYELASPVLRGWDGIDEVRVVCEAMTKEAERLGVELTTKRCGVHVHVSADDLDGAGLRNLVQGVKKWEPMFYATQPTSRFASDWARPVACDMKRIKTVRDARNVRDVWETYPNASDGRGARYHGLNLTPYWRQGSVEFRYFAATFNFEKASFDIMLAVLTVEAAKHAGQVRCSERAMTFDAIWSEACREGLGTFARRFFRDYLQIKSTCNPAFKALKAFARKRIQKFYPEHFEAPVAAAV